jgi:hypothetical protein
MMYSVASLRVSSGLPLGTGIESSNSRDPYMSSGTAVSLRISDLSSTPVLLRNGGFGRRPYSNKIAIKNLETGSLGLQSLDC